ncbi:RNA pyrophosphohydrolase [Verrucomicrobiales bacterium]|nr:RNA pyrophosphohydrolase [Verrucomicrobiales bacterium]
MATYRPNVAAILRNPKTGKILVGERIDHKKSWQFPQGGVDKREDLISALYREVEEEIGVPRDLYTLVECRTDYRYKFPAGHLKKGKYCGQIQTYFLCDYHGTDKDFDLDAHVREFSQLKWIKPKKFRLWWVPRFKREVFRRVLRDFFGVTHLPETKPTKKKKLAKKASESVR